MCYYKMYTIPLKFDKRMEPTRLIKPIVELHESRNRSTTETINWIGVINEYLKANVYYRLEFIMVTHSSKI